MENFQSFIIIISAIALFVYGLQSFSKEIELFGIEKLKKWIQKITRYPLGGFFLGAVFTAIIQSSTMVSSLTVTFVDAAIISFRTSLQILLGANIGTTSTAWIVSFQSDLLGAAFIVLGTIISMIPTKIATAGKAIFYFGFIFFSLSLISHSVEPLKDDPYIREILTQATNPLLGILYGILITMIVQSSSVVIGLSIVLVSQDIMPVASAVPIVIGANVGTTSTALIVSIKMSNISKLSALANFGFNFFAMLIVFPFINQFIQLVTSFSEDTALQIAYATTIFSAFTSILFLILLKPVYLLLSRHRWYKDT